MRDGQPTILIEAKAATADFSSPVEAPPQLQRYFMAENAEFAVLTSGVVWQWYRAGQDGNLLTTPFLVHDVRSPSTSELGWLLSVSEPHFEPASTRAKAEEAGIASAIMAWIEEARRQPGDDLVRLIIRAKELGYASTARVERIRRSFVSTFEAYMDRESDRLLAAARDQQREEQQATSEGLHTAASDADHGEAVPHVDLGDGGSPIRYEYRERAWRVKGGPWRREKNGRDLMISVIRHLASHDVRGRQRFYGEAVDQWGEHLFSDPGEDSTNWRRVEPDIDKWVWVHRSHRNMEAFLKDACSQCQLPIGAPIRLGEDIELVLDMSPK